ncbi:metallophosphoesterase [Anaerolactibacter massiliensis]|jgi:predicted MPP superfamily phosphohydrolase|uniref:metallophosphoesterase n=1 Tax=Anaerolactibacter massiliensis TaxID=2044573 RepID=UPI000CF93363|nr:metallophosphoesterase [Anaerolactibacter massiliensis]MCI2153102.1 metallophosphoesterase [Solobacterium sp.]MCI6746308.1 metallophosphoesterase [Anaerolactibacter massiliensis]MDY4682480.1 metallophosphoesterase [Lachnospiraceae bacterium]
MKVGQKIAVILSLLICLGGAMYYDAFHTAPSRFQVRYETLESVFIPASMDGVSIVFFSDLDYNHFMDEERMTKLVNTINSLSPDIILFGGDLFDQDPDYIDDTVGARLTELLKELDAPLGKFTVLGDFDETDDSMESYVKQILYDADFEVLQNQSVLLRRGGSDSITLVGIEPQSSDHQDLTAAYSSVSRTAYTIALCHTPDTAALVSSELTDYFLAGHSHGGQAYWGFGALYMPEYAQEYFRGKHTVSGFTLDITNGVGTTIQDVRFLANAEVVRYELKHKAVTDSAQ